ncbi:REP-associated tyrosine transposase [Methylomagnum sp.]
MIRHIEDLRTAFRETRRDHPFSLDGAVILPDYLHCLWRLPPDDDDFPTRWWLIKSRFSQRIETGGRVSASRQKKAERGIWQCRYWEHAIRDERDYQKHLDYIHYNPVKHGFARAAKDWPYSTFNAYVGRGTYSIEWSAPQETRKLALD